MDAVTMDDIEDWIDDLDGVESDATFDNYAKHIRAFFSHFVEEEVIKENPALRIKRRGEGKGQKFHGSVFWDKYHPRRLTAQIQSFILSDIKDCG